MSRTNKGAAWLLALALIPALVRGSEKPEEPKSSMINRGYHAIQATLPAGGLIAAANAVGAPGYHRHLLNSGLATTYLVRVLNEAASPVEVELSLAEPPPGWSTRLAEARVSLSPGQSRWVELTLAAASSLRPGAAAAVRVMAAASSGAAGEIALEAETTAKHKIYYVSIDSLGPEYLALNAQGNGPGQAGDWLMPNLKALLAEGEFFPNHESHLVSATDMNHAAYLSGAYPGRLGLYCVDVFLFGFNRKGVAIYKTTPLDLMYYGAEGKPVTTVFNVVKDPASGGNPAALTAYVSGKAWVPEHYRNPVFGLDRIVTLDDRPDYVAPYAGDLPLAGVVRETLQVLVSRVKNPDLYLWEDAYTVDQAIEVVRHEDPDVLYVLLGAVDAAGHIYGGGHDLAEWDERGTPDDLADDRSRINDHGNRLGIIKTVKNADAQLGRFLDFLKARGAYENSLIVAESDHNLETSFFAGPPISQIVKTTGYSDKKDFYIFTASQLGSVFLRRDDPEILAALEPALESYRMNNPLTGELECPLVAVSREEMKTGVDRVTGEALTPPMELYSEFYLEHPRPGGLRYPDLMLFAKKNYQFPVVGVGLANVGFPLINIPIPPINVQVGAHGGPSTRPALLGVRGPGIPKGVVREDHTHPADVAPFLYRREGYRIPESVQGQAWPE